MSWEHHHSASEILAGAAQAMSKLGHDRRAIDLYKSAADEEKRALTEVDGTRTRTLGVTAVSAIALYYKAGETTTAKNLARQWLNKSSLPSFAREQIEEILNAIGEDALRPSARAVDTWNVRGYGASTLLRWTASTAAILYASASCFAFVRSLTVRSTTGLDIGWGLPENYQFVVALCLIAAAIALLFLRSVANLVAILMFGAVITTFYRWSVFTNGIKTNMGLAVIPQTNTISNQLFGAGVLDVLVLVLSVGFFGLNLFLLWTSRKRTQSFAGKLSLW